MIDGVAPYPFQTPINKGARTPMAASTKSPLAASSARWPGLLLSFGIAAVAWLLGERLPLIGGAVFGILLGMLLRATGRVDARFRPGIAFSSRQVLQASVILLGAGLSLRQIVTTGLSSLAVMLSTLAACLIAAWLLGRTLRIPANLTTMIGVGTAICGGSAIAAVAPIVEAEEQEVAYAVSTIFLFNVAAVVIFPMLGHWLSLSQSSFGLWAGTAVNDTSSVVATGYLYGQEAGTYATVVKLTRTTLIIPIAFTLAALRAHRLHRSGGAAAEVRLSRLIPWFVVWFLVAALLNTVGVLPAPVVQVATKAARFLIVVALTAVGLSADFRQMTRTGWKPLGLGFALWAIVATSSLVVQHLMGQL